MLLKVCGHTYTAPRKHKRTHTRTHNGVTIISQSLQDEINKFWIDFVLKFLYCTVGLDKCAAL